MPTASPTPHSRLIEQAAREILSPLHIFQKGRSRVWIDDHRWWLINIEFQPSSWTKGSYLNVGAMWLWSENGYFSFDVGSRVEELVTYESEGQFASEARRLALVAREQVVNFRKQFPSITAAARFLSTHASDTEDPWRLFHAGIALGCIGQIAPARNFFRRLMEQEPTYGWQQTLHEKTREMAELLTDQSAFQTRINVAVRLTRERLKLPEYPGLRIT